MPENPLLFVDLNGAGHIEPSISLRSTFDESTAKRFVATNDIVLISAFEGGAPGILVPYINTQELRQIYDPENLSILGTDLTKYLDAPSGDINVRGAYRIYALRLGTPTQGSLILQSSAPANVLTLTSKDYGLYVNKNSVEIATGTIAGKRVTLRFRQELLTLDNLQNQLHLAYTGNGSVATLTITRAADKATRLQTTLTGATDGSISLDLDLTQDAFATLQQLVTYINGQNGYRCIMNRYGQALLASSELDAVSAATIRTPTALAIHYVGAGSACTMTTTNAALNTTVTGGPGGEALTIDLTTAATDTLGELVAYIESLAAYTCTLGPNADMDASCNALLTNVTTQDIRTSTYNLTAQAGKMDYVSQAALGSILYAINTRSPRIMAMRVAGATAAPANLAQTFLAGGTTPTPVLNDWLNALEAIAREDFAGAMLFPVSTDPVVQDAVLAWVKDQHDTYGNAFRTFFGAPDNMSQADMKTLALGYNSTFATLLTQPILAPNGLAELAPLYSAAMLCGAAAGTLPTQPLTKMVLRARGLPARAKYNTPAREDLLSNGVCVLREDKGVGVVVALANTTSLSIDRIDRMLSESMARDTIEQRVKVYVKPLIPRWAQSNLIPIIKGAVRDALQSLTDEGVLSTGINAQGRILPAYLPATIHLQGGVLSIVVHVLIGGEIDHVDCHITIGYQQWEISSDAAA